jgi:hypothetical protein
MMLVVYFPIALVNEFDLQSDGSLLPQSFYLKDTQRIDIFNSQDSSYKRGKNSDCPDPSKGVYLL